MKTDTMKMTVTICSVESSNCVLLFGTAAGVSLSVKSLGTDSQVKQMSKRSHDFVPVNHTDGSWESAAGSFRDRRTTESMTGAPQSKPACDEVKEDRGES